MGLTTEQLDRLATDKKRSFSTEELDQMEEPQQIYIDPEVSAKKTTSYILGREMGLDPDTVGATYSSIIKNVYGEPLKPSAVQKRMQDDGLLANPQADDEEINIISHAIITGTDPPKELMARRNKQRLVKQISDIFENFRKQEEYLFAVPSNQWQPNPNDLRADGTQKGRGYFGVLKRPDGYISTELSIGPVNLGGKETEIPSLVPTLSQDEIDYLLKGGEPTQAIIGKAVEHAKQRIAEGKSPFAENSESPKTWQEIHILSKPDKPDTIFAMPEYDDKDLLDIYSFKSLLEQTHSKQQVEELRRERRTLLMNLHYQVVQEQFPYINSLKPDEFATEHPNINKVSKGFYNSLKTIERGFWSTSVAMGMVWNQPNLDEVNQALEYANLTPEKASSKFGYVAAAMAESIPSFAYNMTVGNMGIWIVEYGNAYQDALNNGASQTQANVISIPVATINTIIENMQIEKIFKFAGGGKEAKNVVKKMIKDRAYKALLKVGLKFTGETVKMAINEGVEGALQQGVSIAVPAFVIGEYPKDENGNIDWVEVGSQMGQSFVGEGLGGLFLGGVGGIYNARQVQSYKNTIASHLIIDEDMSESQSLDIATKIVERLKNNDGNPKEIYREEVGRVKMADNRHKAAAHIIFKGKEITNNQYRQIAIDTTGKSSMTEMNYDEAERFIEALKTAEVKEKAHKPEIEPDIRKDIEDIKEGKEVPEITPTKAVKAKTPNAVASVEPSPPSAAKQAWEMTSTQYKKHIESLQRVQERTRSVEGIYGIPTKAAFEASKELSRIKGGWPHEKQVQQALSEGKPVPLNVLEEYAGEAWADEALAKTEGKEPDIEEQGKLRKGMRKGTLDNTPFGNDKLFQAKIDEILDLISKPKTKAPILSSVEKEKNLKDLKRTSKVEAVKVGASGLVKGLDRAAGIMSTRVKNISLKLFQDIRNKVINPIKIQVAERTQAAHPFIDGINKKLNNADRYGFEVAQWQANQKEIDRIVSKNGLQKEYEQYRQMLDLIYHEGNAVGMGIDYQTAYFPSAVKDFDGLLKELNRQEKYAPIVLAMAEAQKKKGRALNKDEQIQMIDSLLRGYQVSGLTLSKPGFAKERTLIRKDVDLLKYYYGFEEATSRYIESMTDNIQTRKFFGRTTKELVDLRANISRVQTNIARYENDKSKDRTANIKRAKTKLEKLQIELDTKDDGLLKESVGNYVLDLINNGIIKYDQQLELQQLFEGIFKMTSSNKFIHTLRSLEYAGSLAQIPALITQYSEAVLSILKSPVRTLPNWVKTHFGKSEIKLRDIGVAHIGQEWIDADLDSVVTGLLKPFEFIDRVGKEAFVNSVIDKYRKLAVTNPDKVKVELAKYYPETAFDSIINSLKNGGIDNNVKGFALNELADVQPISKMEVPELYAKAGNLRVFYMYKTFVLKRLDIMRNEGYSEIKAGIKSGDNKRVLKGIGRLIWLAFMFSLADSSADVVKDVIRGKPLDNIENYVFDNLLQMILLSKYSISKSLREGPSNFFKDNITLPISNLDSAFRDVMTLMNEDSEKGSELVRRIPWMGEMYYWYMGEGARKIEEGVYDK